jgi:hypothetical protein
MDSAAGPLNALFTVAQVGKGVERSLRSPRPPKRKKKRAQNENGLIMCLFYNNRCIVSPSFFVKIYCKKMIL